VAVESLELNPLQHPQQAVSSARQQHQHQLRLQASQAQVSSAVHWAVEHNPRPEILEAVFLAEELLQSLRPAACLAAASLRQTNPLRLQAEVEFSAAAHQQHQMQGRRVEDFSVGLLHSLRNQRLGERVCLAEETTMLAKACLAV